MQKKSRPPFFPMMIDLYNRSVLIIGGGRVASRRANTLLKCGAKIIAVSPNFCEDFPEQAEKITREFSPQDIHEKFSLVIAATNDREINKLAQKISREKKIPVNVADNQSECDFFFPSLITCGSAAASVCTAGTSSTLTRKLSDRLREIWASWVRECE